MTSTALPARRTTPGVAGYVLAVALSIVVTALGLVAMQFSDAVEPTTGGLVPVLGGAVFALLYVTVVAAFVAPVGVLLLHLACRRIAAQWVHVAVAGLLGLVVAGLAQRVLGGVDGLRHLRWLLVVLPVATALGRASVVPRSRSGWAGRRPAAPPR